MQKFEDGMLVAEGDVTRLISISDRLLDFSARVILLTNNFPSTFAGKHVAGQLIRSCTSVGANYEESRGAQSRQDFVHKLQVAYKESKEAIYWLRLSEKLGFAKPELISDVIKEGKEIHLILAKSVVTTKENQP